MMSQETWAAWSPYLRQQHARQHPKGWPKMAAILAEADRAYAVQQPRTVALEKTHFDAHRHHEVIRWTLMSRGRHRLLPPEPGTTKRIIGMAADFAHISVRELLGKLRTRHIADARMAAMWAIRAHVQLSTTAIGKALGGRDHSTVIHALKTVDADRARFKDAIAYIEDRLG